MILPAQTIRRLKPVTPFVERGVHECGMSYGLSSAGYDVRIDNTVVLEPGAFCLAATLEKFHMPDDVVGMVHDKSTWARKGLSLFNTVIEPGWFGFLTLELVNHGRKIKIEAGSPIAQIVFIRLEEPTEQPYSGKYQDQKRGPQDALHEYRVVGRKVNERPIIVDQDMDKVEAEQLRKDMQSGHPLWRFWIEGNGNETL